MEINDHSLGALFDQLGLASSESAIRTFIKQNAPLPPTMALHQANIWNASQSAFLQQAIEDDADWSEVVDQLNIMLRSIRS
ncbi:MAG: DUF2789 domain-containing protein [Cycloclasticus sp.]|nr:DUF2789 domain-containing protein [Cycloclasticus sp.]